MQVLADEHGNAVHLYDRDCSLQRRHQKVIEEAPAPQLTHRHARKCWTPVLKPENTAALGTFEFLYEDGHYFIEMNTRVRRPR